MSSYQILKINKENITKTSGEKYQNLTEKEKNRKREYGLEEYKNLLEDEKQRLLSYRKTYCKIPKNNCKVAQ